MEITFNGSAKEIAALAAEMQERLTERHDKDAANRQYAEYLGSAVRLFWKLHQMEDETSGDTEGNCPPASEG